MLWRPSVWFYLLEVSLFLSFTGLLKVGTVFCVLFLLGWFSFGFLCFCIYLTSTLLATLLTVATMLYITSPRFTYNWKFVQPFFDIYIFIGFREGGRDRKLYKHFLCVWWEHLKSTLSRCPVHSTAVLTQVQYVGTPYFTLRTCNFVPWTNISISHLLAPGNHCCTLCFYVVHFC